MPIRRALAREPQLPRGWRRAAAPLLALVALVVVAPAGAASLSVEEAQAHAAGGGALLYREQHFLRSEAGRPLERLVVYRCPAGPAFARKRLDYSVSAQAPDFQLDDVRSGYREGLRRLQGRVELFFRARSGGGERHAGLATAPAVADAGFDEFIRAHWQALVGGGALPLQFAVPSRLRSMGFLVARAGSARIAGEPAWVFRLRLEGWLGLVAPSIEVSYSQASRRLLSFQGLGNLRDDRGGQPLQVRIDFPSAAHPATEAQWQAALQAPLAACRTGQ